MTPRPQEARSAATPSPDIDALRSARRILSGGTWTAGDAQLCARFTLDHSFKGRIQEAQELLASDPSDEELTAFLAAESSVGIKTAWGEFELTLPRPITGRDALEAAQERFPQGDFVRVVLPLTGEDLSLDDPLPSGRLYYVQGWNLTGGGADAYIPLEADLVTPRPQDRDTAATPSPTFWPGDVPGGVPGFTDHEEVGTIGAGTPHARMQWFWERMRPHEKLIEELTGWSPFSSKYRFEAAVADAFDKLAEAHHAD